MSHSLDEITLLGYKSIRALKELKLNSGLNILIGANGSGKTNFIRFFEMLSHMVDPNMGLQNYVAERGFADAFFFRGTKVTDQLVARIVFSGIAYSFVLRAAADRSLFFATETGQQPVAPRDYNFKIVNTTPSGYLETKIGGVFKNLNAEWVLNAIRGWRIYHFHDTSASAPVKGICNIVDNESLHGDASNLAAFLMLLQEKHSSHFDQINEAIRQVAPFFGEFFLREKGNGQTQLLWKDRYSDTTNYPFQLSDGTLRYICLATLLLQPNPPSIIIIDEPELGLHPYAIKLLASMLHEASTRAQIIVSTQSSQLLDEMGPEQVIVVNQRDGQSIIERLDAEKLQEWLKEYTLGQLWEKNELGGVP